MARLHVGNAATQDGSRQTRRYGTIKRRLRCMKYTLAVGKVTGYKVAE